MKIWKVEVRDQKEPKTVYTNEILEAQNYIEAGENAIKANEHIKAIVTKVELIAETTIGE